MSHNKKYIGYHFTNAAGTLRYGDGRQVRIGETLNVVGEPELCRWGLHCSQTVREALVYGNIRLWKVELGGKILNDDDKLVGTERTALIDYGNILPLIVEYANWCADRAAKYANWCADRAAKYAAKYAAESAKYAAEYAEYAAEYAEYAAEYAEYSKSTEYAESAEYAAESAEYAAESAKYAAESAKYVAESVAKSERDAQDAWWEDKLAQLKG